MTPPLLILLSLLDGPKHGYAIAADIESFAGKRLGPGTLYGAIGRLVDAGQVVELAEVDRRKPFQITERGRQLVLAETAAMSAMVKTAKARRVDQPVSDPA